MNKFDKVCGTLHYIIGNVKFVTVDIAKHPYRTPEKKLVLPAMKKFLQAYIPQGEQHLSPQLSPPTSSL